MCVCVPTHVHCTCTLYMYIVHVHCTCIVVCKVRCTCMCTYKICTLIVVVHCIHTCTANRLSIYIYFREFPCPHWISAMFPTLCYCIMYTCHGWDSTTSTIIIIHVCSCRFSPNTHINFWSPTPQCSLRILSGMQRIVYMILSIRAPLLLIRGVESGTGFFPGDHILDQEMPLTLCVIVIERSCTTVYIPGWCPSQSDMCSCAYQEMPLTLCVIVI